MNGLLITFLICLGITVVVLAITIPLSVVDKKYRDFASAHSLALKELRKINNHYRFNKIKEYDQVHSYDNEKYYNNISPKDYLIYQLVDVQDLVWDAMNDTYGNRIMFEKYKNEISEKCHLNNFDAEIVLKSKDKLAKVEKKLFEKLIKAPRIKYWINVCLRLTKINDRYVCSKSDIFYESEIRDLIKRINNKRNDFYLDEEIWKAICRVERGKVTNKLRFAIYARDGNRCRICGRRTNDLEIDHVVPIAKGGKTTYANLQTLCSSCNKKKGSNIESPNGGYSRW